VADLDSILSKTQLMPNGCMEWTGFRSQSGYGQAYNGRRSEVAHRVVYKLAFGEIPEGMQILHSCDNPPCVNPAHLSIGTPRENSLQAVKRRRHAKVQNTHCPQGHSYEEHGRLERNGWRACKLCSRIKQRIKAGWPADIAESLPKRQGRVPVGIASQWRANKVLKGRAVKTHCKNGHPLSGDNLYRRPDGHRQCKACHHEAVKRFKPKPPSSGIHISPEHPK
jgi:HNH endonuclease